MISRALRNVLEPYLRHILWTMPIRITVDFSRNQNHHIIVHKTWIKVGWFQHNNALQDGVDMHDTLEFCEQCLLQHVIPDPQVRGLYVLVAKYRDGCLLRKLLMSKRKYFVSFTRGYYPQILGISTKKDLDVYNLQIGENKPLKNPHSRLVIGWDREKIATYGHHRLYRNMHKTFI